MKIAHWIAGGLLGLLAISWLFSFGLGIAFNNDIWLRRSRVVRQLIYVFGLFWFNLEVWGRVVYTIVTWKT